MIYTQAELNQLVRQSQLKDLYTNDYLQDKGNENYKIISELFFNGDKNRTKYFNVWTNLFSTITDTIAYFVWNPNTELNINLIDYTKDLVSVGKSVFWIKRIDNGTLKWELQIYHIPAENHIISDWISKVFTLFKNLETDWEQYYILKQEFDIWIIRNNLYKLTSMVDTVWEEVPLDTIPDTAWLESEIHTWLNISSLFYIDLNQVDWVQSELDKIKNMVYSLDRKAVMFETQFLGELEQFKIFENIEIPPEAYDLDWDISIAKLPKVLSTDSTTGNSWTIKYISNKNDLIQDAINYEQTQIRKISSATSIPIDFLWIQSTSAISWTSRQIMISAFTKKIQWYREKLTEILTQILELFNKEQKTDTKITWSDIIAKDNTELVNEIKTARESGIISQYTWIEKYLWYKNPEDIQKELDLIYNENQWKQDLAQSTQQ